jgi:hypothetical protein
MSRTLIPLLMQSAQLQQKIADVRAKPNPNRLLILRMQTLRLIIQRRIIALLAAMRSRQHARAAHSPITFH